VVTKFSTRNPAQELAMAGMLADSFDKVFMGHQISGSLNFPRRVATTFLNASVYPLHKQFFEAVNASLAEKGLHVPIHVLKADGGTMNLAASMDFPGQTVLSGPAASVMGALPAAPLDEQVLVLDIGGTTTDMAVLLDGVPLLEPVGIRLGGFQTLIRSLQTQSIGIGGDSAINVVEGKLKVGPMRKGPAMAYGGDVPTPTDALLVLNPKKKTADFERARQGVQALADAMGRSIETVAENVVEITCATIIQEAFAMVDQINRRPVYTIHELQEERLIRPQRILVLGGPAPEFADPLSIQSGLPVAVVPRWQVANAIGAALARITCAVTLVADTELGLVAAPEESFQQTAPPSFTQADALAQAYTLLRTKARAKGAHDSEQLAIETIEAQQFNMVRGFNTTGRNIRVKVQVKPGLIDHPEILSPPD
jgi:N-methylhydantoinase A/oxoprolinase/acetone carboxylase beta subunit